MSWKDPVDVLIIFMCTLIVVYGIACGFTGLSTGKKEPSDDGTHFVVCPECNGTGKEGDKK